jgi:hypothetical protein
MYCEIRTIGHIFGVFHEVFLKKSGCPEDTFATRQNAGVLLIGKVTGAWGAS